MNQVGTQECASTFARLLHESGTRFLLDPDFDFDESARSAGVRSQTSDRIPYSITDPQYLIFEIRLWTRVLVVLE
jgi:hypothetical protein